MHCLRIGGLDFSQKKDKIIVEGGSNMDKIGLQLYTIRKYFENSEDTDEVTDEKATKKNTKGKKSEKVEE